MISKCQIKPSALDEYKYSNLDNIKQLIGIKIQWLLADGSLTCTESVWVYSNLKKDPK